MKQSSRRGARSSSSPSWNAAEAFLFVIGAWSWRETETAARKPAGWSMEIYGWWRWWLGIGDADSVGC